MTNIIFFSPFWGWWLKEEGGGGGGISLEYEEKKIKLGMKELSLSHTHFDTNPSRKQPSASFILNLRDELKT